MQYKYIVGLFQKKKHNTGNGNSHYLGLNLKANSKLIFSDKLLAETDDYLMSCSVCEWTTPDAGALKCSIIIIIIYRGGVVILDYIQVLIIQICTLFLLVGGFSNI